MCIQKHPCRYKCFENYSALFNDFAQFSQNNPNLLDCECKRTPCQNSINNYNYFNCPCRKRCGQNKKTNYNFCIQGTIKLNGSC